MSSVNFIIRKLFYFFIKFKNKKILLLNNELRNKYSGDCHIIATGVSINDYDLNLLTDGFKIGIGFVQYNNKIPNDYFDAYIDVDPLRTFKRLLKEKYIWFYSSLDKKITKKKAIFFFRTSVRDLIRSHKLFQERNVHYVDVSLSGFDEHHTDITKRFPLAQGGVSAAITIAMFMGFKRIYLHGTGYTYKPMQVFHYYEEYLNIQNQEKILPANFFEGALKISECNTEQEREKVIGSIEKDKKILFEKFIIRDGRLIARFFQESKDDYKSHEFLKEYAHKNNVEIINVVPNGLRSGVYNSITPDKLIRIKKKNSGVS